MKHNITKILSDLQLQMNEDAKLVDEVQWLSDDCSRSFVDSPAFYSRFPNLLQLRHYRNLVEQLIITEIAGDKWLRFGDMQMIQVMSSDVFMSFDTSIINFYSTGRTDCGYITATDTVKGIYAEAINFVFGQTLWFGELPEGIREITAKFE